MTEQYEPIAPTPGLNGGESSAWVNLDDYDLSLITDEEIENALNSLDADTRQASSTTQLQEAK